MRLYLFKVSIITLLATIVFSIETRADVFEGECGEYKGAHYITDGVHMEIEGYGGVDNLPKKFRATIKSINIHEGITYIGNNVFREFTQLEEVTFPSTLKSVGQNAFYNTTSLKSAIFKSYTRIDRGAFNSSGIKEFYLREGEIIYDGTPSFGGCDSLKKITVPIVHEQNFRKMFRYVFAGKYFTADSVFWAPPKLKSVTIYANPEKEREFSIGLLFGCYSFKENSYTGYSYLGNGHVLDTLKIVASDNVKNLVIRGDLESEKFVDRYVNANEYETICGMDFKYLDLSMINIDQNSQTDRNLLINSTSNLEHLILPQPSQYFNALFGEYFAKYSNKAAYSISQEAMDGKLHNYSIPSTLKTVEIRSDKEMIIPYGWLSGVNIVETVILPASVYEVGEKAFRKCSYIKDFYCAGADPAVAFENSFEGMRFTSCTLHVPAGASNYYKKMPGWNSFFNIEENGPLTLVINKNIENAGVVYGCLRYFPGDMVDLNAVANDGYKFSSWNSSAGGYSTSPNYSFKIENNTTVNLNFESVDGNNKVEVTVENSSATIAWPEVESAAYYHVNIFSVEDNSTPIASFVINPNENARSVSRASGSSLSCYIENLDSETQYKYLIDAYSDDDSILSCFSGIFSISASVKEIMDGNPANQFNIISGGLEIVAEGLPVCLTDLSGRIIFKENNSSYKNIKLSSGIYVLIIGGKSYKLMI